MKAKWNQISESVIIKQKKWKAENDSRRKAKKAMKTIMKQKSAKQVIIEKITYRRKMKIIVNRKIEMKKKKRNEAIWKMYNETEKMKQSKKSVGGRKIIRNEYEGNQKASSEWKWRNNRKYQIMKVMSENRRRSRRT